MPRPDHRKSEDAFPTSCPTQKDQEWYWDPFFLMFLVQDVYQDIVIRPCNVQKCRQDLIFQIKSRFDLGGQHHQAVRRTLTFSKAKLGPG
jgi:hypothetical protein